MEGRRGPALRLWATTGYGNRSQRSGARLSFLLTPYACKQNVTFFEPLIYLNFLTYYRSSKQWLLASSINTKWTNDWPEVDSHVVEAKMTAPARWQSATIVAVVWVHVLVENRGSHIGEPLEVVGEARAEHAAVHGAVNRSHPRKLGVKLRHIRLISLRGCVNVWGRG